MPHNIWKIAEQMMADLIDEGFDFQADIDIDPEALDLEWLNHPGIVRRYSMAAVIARKERDIAKMAWENLKNECKETQEKLKSELYLKARRGGKELLKLDKDPTNDAISAWVAVHPDLAKLIEESTEHLAAAYNDYLKASTKHGFLASALQAIEVRKSALENEVRLLGMNYFAPPKEPRDLGAAYADQVRERNAGTKKQAVVEQQKQRVAGRSRTK
jgi:hypothetical protein